MTVKEFCSYCIDDEQIIYVYSYTVDDEVWKGIAANAAADMPPEVENLKVSSIECWNGILTINAEQE